MKRKYPTITSLNKEIENIKARAFSLDNLNKKFNSLSLATVGAFCLSVLSLALHFIK